MKFKVNGNSSFKDILELTKEVESMWAIYPGAKFDISTVEEWEERKGKYTPTYTVKVSWEEER